MQKGYGILSEKPYKHNNPITFARYVDHKTSYFHTLFNKDPSTFGQICDLFFVIEFQICGSEHDHGFLWIKHAPIYGKFC